MIYQCKIHYNIKESKLIICGRITDINSCYWGKYIEINCEVNEYGVKITDFQLYYRQNDELLLTGTRHYYFIHNIPRPMKTINPRDYRDALDDWVYIYESGINVKNFLSYGNDTRINITVLAILECFANKIKVIVTLENFIHNKLIRSFVLNYLGYQLARSC